jgi:hypothetical protein
MHQKSPKIEKFVAPQSKGGKKMQSGKSRNTWKLVTNQPSIDKSWTPFTPSKK